VLEPQTAIAQRAPIDAREDFAAANIRFAVAKTFQNFERNWARTRKQRREMAELNH
jgi:hypothetical protein